MTGLSPAMLEGIFDVVATGIVVLQDAVIVRANATFAALVGYDRDAITGSSFAVYLHPDDTEAPPVPQREARLLRKDGKTIWTRLRTLTASGHDVLTVEDITETKRVDRLRRFARELEVQKAELNDFAAIASHDLREPLRKIDAFGERLATRYADKIDAEGRDYLARMCSASKRMQVLIDDLLAFASVGETHGFERVSLQKIAAEVLVDLEARVEETRAIVKIGTLPTIDAEPTQMRQLFQNLIGNALKFHAPNECPVVAVRAQLREPWEGTPETAREDAVCQIIVADEGIGFAARHADRIFMPFHRLHPKNVFEGSGLGLAICRKIVDRHRGTITAGASPSGGALFTVTLPVRRT